MDIESKLQLEYLQLIDELYKIQEYIEAEIKSILKEQLFNSAFGSRKAYKILVSSRIKSCFSAIKSLKKKAEGRVFRGDKKYSITDLNDLIGARVSVFPRTFLEEVKEPLSTYLNEYFIKFDSDPETEIISGYNVYKYRGSHRKFSKFSTEIQLVPLLVSQFWDIEHAAMYKSDNLLHSALPMKEAYRNVLQSLFNFEMTFEQREYKKN